MMGVSVLTTVELPPPVDTDPACKITNVQISYKLIHKSNEFHMLYHE